MHIIPIYIHKKIQKQNKQYKKKLTSTKNNKKKRKEVLFTSLKQHKH
jgi:hypothetical protein